MRIQSSWILELASEMTNIHSIFFPFVDKYSSLLWFKNRCIPTIVRSSHASQKLILNSFIDKEHGYFSDFNTRKYNQYLHNPLDIQINPFKQWKDKYFTKEQLDYLFYWHEAALEIEDVEQKEIFWACIYYIINYWITMYKFKTQSKKEPDEIMHYILSHQKADTLKDTGAVSIIDATEPFNIDKVGSLTVFPLLIEGEFDDQLLIDSMFHSWVDGHSDIVQSQRDIKSEIGDFVINFETEMNLDRYVKLSENSEIICFTWNGEGLPPSVFERQVVIPLQNSFAKIFKHSKLSIKCVNPRNDEYDYLLVFSKK